MDPGHFITIDIDLESQQDVSPLIAELGDAVTVWQNTKSDGVHRFAYSAGINGDAEAMTRGNLALIEGLSPEGRTLWDGCFKRVFDYGFQGGIERFSIAIPIGADLIAALAGVGAGITVTIYAARQD